MPLLSDCIVSTNNFKFQVNTYQFLLEIDIRERSTLRSHIWRRLILAPFTELVRNSSSSFRFLFEVGSDVLLQMSETTPWNDVATIYLRVYFGGEPSEDPYRHTKYRRVYFLSSYSSNTIASPGNQILAIAILSLALSRELTTLIDINYYIIFLAPVTCKSHITYFL